MMKRVLIPVLAFFCFFPLAADNYGLYSDEQIEQLSAKESRGHVSEKDAVITSESTINWTTSTFTSNIALNVVKANIPMPSGKSTSINRIQMELPVLVKDPLLSINVDNSKSLGDIVLEGRLTLEELTRIIDSSSQTPAYFKSGTSSLLTQHNLKMQQVSSLLVKHNIPYTRKPPIETVSSMAYTGIIIDARGQLPVHGEFVTSETYPCMFPKVWSENMELIYERNMVLPEIAKKSGIVHYSSSIYPDDYIDRAGKKPLWITAKKVFGEKRTDPVISYDDYLKIVSVKENLKLFEEGKVVILLDDSNLIYKVSVPDKNKEYYITYHKLKRYFTTEKIPDAIVLPGDTGIKIVVDDLHFIPDSEKLLPAEIDRVTQITESIKKFTADGEFTILVEGHTADLNKPAGQLDLSNRRALEIINILVASGIDKNILSYKGYGATKPRADNSTDEGRAQNRRVEIVIIPKSTTQMRN